MSHSFERLEIYAPGVLASALVTVVIVNWNGGKFLAQCLAALQRQTCAEFLCIVADNGSSDGSGELVTELNDARFSLLKLGENLGFARANNIAVSTALTPWIALINPDAFAEPEWLARMLMAAHKLPQVAALGCTLVDARNCSLLDGTGDMYYVSGRAFRRDHAQPRKSPARVSGEIFSPCAAAAFYRRSAWIESGGLDEDFFCYMEDVDLAFRLRLLGWKCWYVAEANCLHVGSGLTGRRSEFSSFYGQRNLVWAYVKNMPGALFWIFLPVHLLANLAAIMLFSFRGQGRIVLKAKRQAIARLPFFWRKRKKVQSLRRVGLAAIWKELKKSV